MASKQWLSCNAEHSPAEYCRDRAPHSRHIYCGYFDFVIAQLDDIQQSRQLRQKCWLNAVWTMMQAVLPGHGYSLGQMWALQWKNGFIRKKASCSISWFLLHPYGEIAVNNRKSDVLVQTNKFQTVHVFWSISITGRHSCFCLWYRGTPIQSNAMQI